MKWLACFGAATAMAWAQSGGALLSNQDALKLEQRTVQLMESTGLAVPGLTRAGAPALEDARQTLRIDNDLLRISQRKAAAGAGPTMRSGSASRA